MSELRYCDPGKHIFVRGTDEDEREFAETKERDGVRTRIDVCGPCHRGVPVPRDTPLVRTPIGKGAQDARSAVVEEAREYLEKPYVPISRPPASDS